MLPAEVRSSGVDDWKFTTKGTFRIVIRRDGEEVDIKSDVSLSEIQFRAGDYVRIRNYKNQPEVHLLRQTLFEAFEQTGLIGRGLLNQIVSERLYFQEWQSQRGELENRTTEDALLDDELRSLCERFGKDRIEEALHEMEKKALRNISDIELMRGRVEKIGESGR